LLVCCCRAEESASRQSMQMISGIATQSLTREAAVIRPITTAAIHPNHDLTVFKRKGEHQMNAQPGPVMAALPP